MFYYLQYRRVQDGILQLDHAFVVTDYFIVNNIQV